jgi:putative endonuclease
MMMKAFVYVLFSCSLNRFYTGSTVILPCDRLDRHLKEYYKDAWTKRAKDWELYWSLECESKRQALAIEKHIKMMRNRTYFENLKRFSEISLALLRRYRDKGIGL